jgi:hypothetical protein
MTEKVFALDTKPGIQRDGTIVDASCYTDGEWVRFQRGRPRKMAGYQQTTNDWAGPSRGLFIDPRNGFNVIYNGYSDGVQTLTVDQNGIGAGIIDFTLSNFTPSANNLWQFDAVFDASGNGVANLIAHPGQNLTAIDSTVNTPVLFGPSSGTTLSQVGVFTLSAAVVNASTTVTVASTLLIGAGQVITGTNIPASTTVVSVTNATTFVISNAATGSATVTITINNSVSVSGGAVMLFPYLFTYGNFGLIRNSGAGNLNDWVSATANSTNITSTKVVKGLPVRGGSNAPSGLFWSLDSLVRVSFTPTTVTTGVTSSTFYWRYDIISSQSSIMSSQGVIEYDGIYYWCGIDRFLLYGGTVQEIPNTFNQNYFFDNVNYTQRQKVFAMKVPRYGEIWWYYPRGQATECTDAVIYNVREKCWYDAGEALGSQRCAGYFSQVFHYPVLAGYATNASGGVNAATITTGGTSYTNGTYQFYALTGGSGTGATATITVAGGVVTTVVINNRGQNYTIGNVLSAVLPVGSGFTLTVGTLMTFTSLWQHEIGVDLIAGTNVLAIKSSFETNDIGWVSGGPSEPSLQGVNRWLRLERVEPDFIQEGQMELYITGRPYAQTADKVSSAFVFTPTTGKIDMKEQRREMRLIFVSDIAGGDYQLGKVMLSGAIGDVRGYE